LGWKYDRHKRGPLPEVRAPATDLLNLRSNFRTMILWCIRLSAQRWLCLSAFHPARSPEIYFLLRTRIADRGISVSWPRNRPLCLTPIGTALQCVVDGRGGSDTGVEGRDRPRTFWRSGAAGLSLPATQPVIVRPARSGLCRVCRVCRVLLSRTVRGGPWRSVPVFRDPTPDWADPGPPASSPCPSRLRV